MLLLVVVDELLGGHDRLIPRLVFAPDAIHDISRGGAIVRLEHGESHDRGGPRRVAELQDIDAVPLVLCIPVILVHDAGPFLPTDCTNQLPP